MRYVRGDITQLDKVDNLKVIARCFTSNGETNRKRELIMGKGVALAIKLFYPGVCEKAGDLVKRLGNHTHLIGKFKGQNGKDSLIISFPTKKSWRDPSDIDLIVRSATELAKLIEDRGWTNPILLTKPGCGNGGLEWDYVKPFIENILPSNVYIVINK